VLRRTLSSISKQNQSTNQIHYEKKNRIRVKWCCETVGSNDKTLKSVGRDHKTEKQKKITMRQNARAANLCRRRSTATICAFSRRTRRCTRAMTITLGLIVFALRASGVGVGVAAEMLHFGRRAARYCALSAQRASDLGEIYLSNTAQCTALTGVFYKNEWSRVSGDGA
jgi:hypothetical protein